MARTVLPDALLNLRSAQSVQDQVAALRRLKNDLIGHDQRKEACIRHGVVDILVELLNGALRSGGKRRRVSANSGSGSGSNGQAAPPAQQERRPSVEERWSDEDELRLQCTIVVGSLAQGGLAYVTPLVARGTAQPLLSALPPRESPARLVAASLKTLLVCAEALSESTQHEGKALAAAFADQLFSRSEVGAFADILSQSSTSKQVEEQKSLTAQLITAACHTSSHQSALLKAGVLDLLAARLSAMAMVDRSPKLDRETDMMQPTPLASSPHNVTEVLEAISAIVIHSAYHTARLVYSPAIVGTFPVLKPQSALATGPLFDTTASRREASQPESVDRLLPQLDNVQAKPETNFSKAFPALGSFASEHQRSEWPLSELAMSYAVKPQAPARTTSQEFGTQLVSWLLYVARTTIGMDRLAAVWLLTIIISAKDKIFPEVAFAEPGSTRSRDRTLSYLLVPLVVRMIEESNTLAKASPSDLTVQIVRERAIRALGMLVADSITLEKAAVDAGAIKLLCQILKKTFDPIPNRRRPMWTPTPMEPVDSIGNKPASQKLGSRGLAAEAVHALKCRAGALTTLGQLGQFDDDFRKQMIERGIVSYMVDSLTPYPQQADGTSTPTEVHEEPLDGKKGNPSYVLIAACNLARALSRSVNILRTSLIDGGLAKPILELLKDPALAVQVAATNVICNLTLQFSPMREELLKGGCVPILCQHAHSTDSHLQIMSLWALKHLVNSGTNDVKMYALEELGAGWLVQILSTEIRDSTHRLSEFATPPQSSTQVRLDTSNAAGERVDLLNAQEDASMDLDSSSADDGGDDEASDGVSSLVLPRYLPQQSETSRPITSQYRARLKLIKRDEFDPAVTAWKAEVRVQEQALDFLRNLIGEPQSEQATMVEYILSTFEPQRLFDILAAKITPPSPPPQPERRLPKPHGKYPVLTTPGARSSAHNNSSPLISPYPSTSLRGPPPQSASAKGSTPPEILLSTLFILVHVANGRAQQRALLLAQTRLIEATLPLFSHPDRRIRVACVWLAHNLVWLDSSSTEDRLSAEERARRLRAMGVEHYVRRALDDEDLDVKERAKNVVDSFDKLLAHQDDGPRSPRDATGMLAASAVMSYDARRGHGGRAWER